MDIVKTIFSYFRKVMSFVWGFFRKLQSVVGTLLFVLLLLFIVFSISKEENVVVPAQAALVVSLDGAIKEQKTYNDSPLQAISAGGLQHQTILRDVIKAINLAAEDDRITMMILNSSEYGGALPSKLHYIGDAMAHFRETGKKIVTYGDSFSQGSYLLSSYADEVYLNPYGSVLMYGYGSYHSYYKGFLDKIKAEVQLFRVGKYKSAMEPFIRSDMSPAAKEASRALMGGLWADYTKAVEKGRGLAENSLQKNFEVADTDLAKLQGDTAELALSYGLVDGLKTREEWLQYLAKSLGTTSENLNNKTIGYGAYLAANPKAVNADENVVAVVYANGTIMDGQQPQGVAGGDTVSRHLREARLNNKVKAVVLRVDSPGGSAFASELIRQEVLLLKAAGKPVVVSMGSLAASGGYWISADADEIWASPTTITGSIGIFGAIPNFEGTMAAIGITTDGVGTTPLSVSGVGKPLPEKIKSIIQSSIENGYDRFLNVVAEGRGMTVEQVNEIAQGRVWTGRKALEIGLVDKLGTFDDAVASAAMMAKLKSYKTVYWEDPIPWDIKLITNYMERHAEIGKIVAARLTSPQDILASKILDKLAIFGQLNDPNNSYVLCLSCMEAYEVK